VDPQPPDPRLGLVLQERYRIIDRVGEGAMAVVYRGERIALGKQVAVKFLHPWVAAQPQFRVRFETEARAMSRLNHPNCVSVIDFGFEGAPFVVMDFVSGRTLRALLAETGPLEPLRVIAIMKQILAGLGHAHAQGIVHRDIKPENMMLVAGEGLEDHVRILDFGLAKLHDGPAMTAGFAVGTPSYMSPEQTGGPGEIDLRTDIYAAGVVLFELLTGRKPFLSENVAEIFLMHREMAPPSLREAQPQGRFSPEMERVVAQALAKFADERFATAAAFAAALERTPEAGAGARLLPARHTDLKTEVDPSLAARVMAHLAEEKQRAGALTAVSESGTQVEMELQGSDDPAKTTLTPVARPDADAGPSVSPAAGGALPPPLPSGTPGKVKPVPVPSASPPPGPAGPAVAPQPKKDQASKNQAPKTSSAHGPASAPAGEASARSKRVVAAILGVFFLFAGISLVAVLRNGRAGFAAARQQRATADQTASGDKSAADKPKAPSENAKAPPAVAERKADAPAPSASAESATKPAAAASQPSDKSPPHKAAAKQTSGMSRPAPAHAKPSHRQEGSFFRR
jgi:serine/threonine protein kinase